MTLTKLEREVITDSVLKIESIQASLDQIDEAKIVGLDEIHNCLESADKNFRTALRGSSSPKPTKRADRT
jgi:hypothetical protein